MRPAPVVLLPVLACSVAGLRLQSQHQMPRQCQEARYTWEAADNVSEPLALFRSTEGGESGAFVKADGEKPAEVIFIAGLEGAGHHFIMDIVVKNMRVERKMLQLPFPDPSFRCGHEWKSEGKEKLEVIFSHLSRGRTYVLPECRSFPECGIMGGVRHEGRQKRYHPRLDWIREVAEKTGITLKVLMIYRPMEDCLAANCLHRPIEKCDGEWEVLRHNGLRLATYVRQLPKNMVSCFEYGKMDSMLRAVKKTFGDDLIRPEQISGGFHNKTKAVYLDGRGRINDWNRFILGMGEAERALKGTCTSIRMANMKEGFN